MIPKIGVRICSIPNMDDIGYTASSVSFVIVDIRIVTRKIPNGTSISDIVLLCHGSKNRKTKGMVHTRDKLELIIPVDGRAHQCSNGK